jgi:hypothetical protein
MNLALTIRFLTEPLEPKILRVCVLITKLLQSVSNGIEFDGSKEEYMKRLNPFIKKNRLYVNVFFDSLTVSFKPHFIFEAFSAHQLCFCSRIFPQIPFLSPSQNY